MDVKASLESRSVDFGESDPRTRLNDVGNLVGLRCLAGTVLGAVGDSASFSLVCDGGNKIGGGTKFTVTLIRGRGDRRTGVSTFDCCGKTRPTSNAVWGSELCTTTSEPSTVWETSMGITESNKRLGSGGSTTRSGISKFC